MSLSCVCLTSTALRKLKRKLHLGVMLKACVRTVFCKGAEDRGQARFVFGYGILPQGPEVKAAGWEIYWGKVLGNP